MKSAAICYQHRRLVYLSNDIGGSQTGLKVAHKLQGLSPEICKVVIVGFNPVL